MFQGRPETGAQTGTYDTTDTAGPSARYGKVEDTAPVFGLPGITPEEAPADPGG